MKITEENIHLQGLPAVTVEVLKKAMDHNINLVEYLSHPILDYHYTQLLMILEGVLRNVDTSVYDNPEIDSWQMKFIVGILSEGVTYRKEYSSQHKKIKDLIDMGVPVDKLSKLLEFVFRIYYPYTGTISKILDACINAFNYNIDILEFVRKYEPYSNVLDELVAWEIAKIDPMPYVKNFRAEHLREIRLALLQNVDVTKIAIQGLDDDEMRELRLGLINNIDLSEHIGKDILEINRIRTRLQRGGAKWKQNQMRIETKPFWVTSCI